MPVDQLSFIVFMIFNALALYQKTKDSRPGMGTATQKTLLSYLLDFMSDAPKCKIKFRLLLRLTIWWNHSICFFPLSALLKVEVFIRVYLLHHSVLSLPINRDTHTHPDTHPSMFFPHLKPAKQEPFSSSPSVRCALWCLGTLVNAGGRFFLLWARRNGERTDHGQQGKGQMYTFQNQGEMVFKVYNVWRWHKKYSTAHHSRIDC